MVASARRKRAQGRPGGRTLDESLGPITQAFEAFSATPDCTLRLPSCKICRQLKAENDSLRDQLSFWDTYLVPPEKV